MGVVQKVKNVILPILNAYREFDTNTVLSINDLDINDTNRLIVNGDSFTDLYCVDLAGAGEAVNYVNEIVLDSLFNKYNSVNNSFYVWTLIKDSSMQKNLIFTNQRDIAVMFAKSLNTKILEIDEVMNMLLSLYFHNEYNIDFVQRKLAQKTSIEYEDFLNDPLFNFKQIVKNAAHKNYKTDVYQAISYDNDRVDEKKLQEKKFKIKEFYDINFDGALYTKVHLSKKYIDNMLSLRNIGNFPKLNNDAGRLRELKKDNKKNDRIALNTVLMVFRDPSETAVSMVEKFSYCKMLKVSKSKSKLTNKTPIISSNSDWDRVVDKDFLINYIGYKNKLDSNKPHICGVNQSGSFVNFGFKKATAIHKNAKPHTFLIGTSGSGKTKTANFVVTQLLGWDIDVETIEHPDEVKFRLFDIKQSFYYLVKRIQRKFPEHVRMIDFDKNVFKYNILECDVENGKVVESDLAFASSMVSLVASNGGKNLDDTLTAAEEGEFVRTLRHMYNERNYSGYYIDNIKETHPDAYKELISLGYNPESTLLKDIKEERFAYLGKPVLFSLLRKLEELENGYEVAAQHGDKNVIDSLKRKLLALDSKKIFSYPTNLNLKEGLIIYFNMDTLLGDSDFSPIIFAMQSIISKNDKKNQRKILAEGKERPLIFYMYEEARNLFDNKIFKEGQVFERIINEWRSDDLVFFPITQEPEHIPSSVIKGFEIKFILTYGTDEEERTALINYLGDKLDLGPKRREMLETLPQYTMAAMYADGAFTIKFDITDRHVEYFETLPKD